MMRWRWPFFLPLLLLVGGCLEDPDAALRKSLGALEEERGGRNREEKEPSFDGPNNFFQNGPNQIYHTLLEIHKEIDGVLYLRGRDIHRYLGEEEENRNLTFCLAGRFEAEVGRHKILLWSLIPDSFPNFTTNTREHHFRIHPGDEAVNKNCQTSAVVDTLDGLYPREDITYRPEDLCPNCGRGEFLSSSLELFYDNGERVERVSVGHIRIKIANGPLQDNAGGACPNSNDCRARGFDCCAAGQCVRDRSIKSTADQSSEEFLLTQKQVIFNPSSIFDYPHLYNICPEQRMITASYTQVDSLAPEEDYVDRMQEKKELYDCLNPIEGEMSLCTTIYEKEEGRRDNDDGLVYYTGPDDLNFNTSYSGTSDNLPPHSIHRISYGRIVLFENNELLKDHFSIQGVSRPLPASSIVGNDNFTMPMAVKIFDSFADHPSPGRDKIRITFRTNGSCVPYNRSFAKCKKIYVQGQNLGKVTDHYPSSRVFRLPHYADLTRRVGVSIEGEARRRGADWAIENGAVEFSEDGDTIYEGEEIELEFYVNLEAHNVLQSVEAARSKVRAIYGCIGDGCNLRPLFNARGEIIDYEPVIPDDSPPPPFYKSFFLSTKTVPVRYFDREGRPHSQVDGETPPQEGLPFYYEDKDPGRPNNLNGYVGFNEIYGSLDGRDPNGPIPAYELVLEKGKTYDIYTEQGIFSQCFSCGYDYWSYLLRLFPETFEEGGGGIGRIFLRQTLFVRPPIERMIFSSVGPVFFR